MNELNMSLFTHTVTFRNVQIIIILFMCPSENCINMTSITGIVGTTNTTSTAAALSIASKISIQSSANTI